MRRWLITARFLFVQNIELPGSGRNQIPMGNRVGHAAWGSSGVV